MAKIIFLLSFLACSEVAFGQCRATTINPSTGLIDCISASQTPFTQTFSSQTGLTITQLVHGEGTTVVGFCYDNATPTNLITQNAGFPTVAANGDIVFNWSSAGSKTGTCIVSGLGTGPQGIQGVNGQTGINGGMTLNQNAMGNISGSTNMVCGTPLAFNSFSATLIGDTTLGLDSTCVAGTVIQVVLTQDATGLHKVTWPAGFTAACSPTLDAGITTTETFGWNGTTAALIGDCKDNSTGTLIQGPERTAPGTLPPQGGNQKWWFDATDHQLHGYTSTSTLNVPMTTVQSLNAGTPNQFVDYITPQGQIHYRSIAAADLPGQTSNLGQINYGPNLGQMPLLDLMAIATTAPVTVTNTASQLTIVGLTFNGHRSICAGCLMPGASVRVTAGGTIACTGTPTLTFTLFIGATAIATFTPTLGSGESSNWYLDYTFTATSISAVNGSGCLWRGQASSIPTCSSATTTGLNFATAQTLDLQVQWGTPSNLNTVVSNSFIARGNI